MEAARTTILPLKSQISGVLAKRHCMINADVPRNIRDCAPPPTKAPLNPDGKQIGFGTRTSYSFVNYQFA